MSLESHLTRALALLSDCAPHRHGSGLADLALSEVAFTRLLTACDTALLETPKPDRLACQNARTSATLSALAATPLELKVKKAAALACMQFLKVLNVRFAWRLAFVCVHTHVWEALTHTRGRVLARGAQESIFVSTESTLSVEITLATLAVTVSFIVGDDIVTGEREGLDVAAALNGSSAELALLLIAIDTRAKTLARLRTLGAAAPSLLPSLLASAQGAPLPALTGLALHATAVANDASSGLRLAISLRPGIRLDSAAAQLACQCRFEDARRLPLDVQALAGQSEGRAVVASSRTGSRAYVFTCAVGEPGALVGRFVCGALNDPRVLDDAAAFVRQRALLQRALASCFNDANGGGPTATSIETVDVAVEGRPGHAFVCRAGAFELVVEAGDGALRLSLSGGRDDAVVAAAAQRVWDACGSLPAAIHLCRAAHEEAPASRKRMRG